jgi:hypothetical protein
LHDRRDVSLCFFAYEIVKLLFRHHAINLTLCGHKGGKDAYATILSRRELERIRDLGECRFLGFAHGDAPDA